jgi:hypothetical protein
MYRCVTNITITQLPSVSFPNRKTVLGFDFVNEFECSDSWRDLTNKGKMVLPKNLYFRDQFGKLQPLHGTNINIGGFSSNAPLLLRGDKIKIVAGYKYFDKAGREITDTATMFEGYISKVGSKIPIECELEDNMWLLKQTPVGLRTFSKSDKLSTILAFILHGTGFTYNALTETTFGAFSVGNETACQVLQRLQKTYGFESYFRGNELRCGAIIYIPGEGTTQNFFFQQNIISDELEYVRKDDITLSAVAHNYIEELTGKHTKDGQAKTKRTRLEVLVTLRNGVKTIKEIKKGDTVPSNNEGERRTLFYPGAKTVSELADLAFKEIVKYYYTGLRGKFTTFGIPFVRQGDVANIQDPILPERNGLYKIKQVDYTGGVSGLRQEISLDFKLNTN